MGKEIHYDRRWFLGTAAMTIAAAQLRIIGTAAAQLAIEGELPSHNYRWRLSLAKGEPR